MKSLTVYACEPRPIVVAGLEKALEDCSDLVFGGARATLEEALAPVCALRPDVLLLDQSVGLKAVLQFISEVKGRSPETQSVVWVNELAEIEYFRALQLGARGILKKTMSLAQLVECLRAVGNGNIWIENSISNQVVGYLNRKNAPRLTPRERDIVKCICRGLKNKQIAEALSITPGTVKVHLMHIFEKTGAKDRFELAGQGRLLLGAEFEEGDLKGTAAVS